MKSPLRFSWTGLLLAPLPMPFLFALAMEIANPGKNPLLGFAFMFIIGAIASYGVTVVLFLPIFHLLVRFVRPTMTKAAIVGTVLGFLILFPEEWFEYTTSGVDSGPPSGTYAQWLWRSRLDVTLWIFPVAGLITALLYWYFASRKTRQAIPPPNPAPSA